MIYLSLSLVEVVHVLSCVHEGLGVAVRADHRRLPCLLKSKFQNNTNPATQPRYILGVLTAHEE